MAVNWTMLQGIFKIIREAGPLINDIKTRYSQRGVDEDEARTVAELTVVLDQVLEEKLRGVARQESVERLRMEFAREISNLKNQEAEKRRYMGWVLLGANLITIVLLIIVLIRL